MHAGKEAGGGELNSTDVEREVLHAHPPPYSSSLPSVLSLFLTLWLKHAPPVPVQVVNGPYNGTQKVVLIKSL